MRREPQSVLQPVDEKALELARKLVHNAPFAALATLEPATGYPQASRIALAIDDAGSPVMLLSELSGHTQALLLDPRASLLCGEPGEGDPLAHPRITLIGQSHRIGREATAFAAVREAYLRRHPKSALYADFGDFAFWVFCAERASLNAGFGRAYQLSKTDLAKVLF